MGDSAIRLPSSAPSGSKTTRILALRALATRRDMLKVCRRSRVIPGGWALGHICRVTANLAFARTAGGFKLVSA